MTERVSTTQKERVCAIVDGRAYCGRKGKIASVLWDRVTCADCLAARRADEEAKR